MTSKDTNPKDAIGDTKIPLWLLSPVAKAHWALAQFLGLVKYGAWNWRVAGVRSSVYLSAAQRHLDAYLSGEETDPVDGTHHLGNIMACCAILLDAKAAGKLTDDRPPSVNHRVTYQDLEGTMVRIKDQYADLNPKHYTIADTAKKTEIQVGDRVRCGPYQGSDYFPEAIPFTGTVVRTSDCGVFDIRRDDGMSENPDGTWTTSLGARTIERIGPGP